MSSTTRTSDRQRPRRRSTTPTKPGLLLESESIAHHTTCACGSMRSNVYTFKRPVLCPLALWLHLEMERVYTALSPRPKKHVRQHRRSQRNQRLGRRTTVNNPSPNKFRHPVQKKTTSEENAPNGITLTGLRPSLGHVQSRHSPPSFFNNAISPSVVPRSTARGPSRAVHPSR